MERDDDTQNHFLYTTGRTCEETQKFVADRHKLSSNKPSEKGTSSKNSNIGSSTPIAIA